nr:immunoglobulin heavy chain junction region [Mus musculus]
CAREGGVQEGYFDYW